MTVEVLQAVVDKTVKTVQQDYDSIFQEFGISGLSAKAVKVGDENNGTAPLKGGDEDNGTATTFSTFLTLLVVFLLV